MRVRTTASSSASSVGEFAGLKGRFFAWFLTSPLRRVLEWKMGTPELRLFELLALEGKEVVVDSLVGFAYENPRRIMGQTLLGDVGYADEALGGMGHVGFDHSSADAVRV